MARTRLARLTEEWTAATPSPGDADAAIAALRVRAAAADAELVRVAGEAVTVGAPVLAIVREGAPREREREGAREGELGRGVGDLRDEEVEVVTVGRGVYASVPTRDGRVKLLRAAACAARRAVVVHVPLTDGAHAARALLDGARTALRRLGVRGREPGDRFEDARYVHLFFDEEELLGEIDAAGLALHRRRGFQFVLTSAELAPRAPAEDTDAFALEVPRVLAMARAVDATRRSETPERALAVMRARGAAATARGPIGRARLRRAIGWVDAIAPGGANCYRRTLLEIALDAGAARETVVFGLDVGRTGHIAFEDREERTFDVSFAVPAERGPDR